MSKFRATFYVEDGEDTEIDGENIEAENLMEAFCLAYAKHGGNLIKVGAMFLLKSPYQRGINNEMDT